MLHPKTFLLYRIPERAPWVVLSFALYIIVYIRKEEIFFSSYQLLNTRFKFSTDIEQTLEISRYRPACPIIGCTMEEKVSRQINLSWGVYPIVIKEEKNVFDLFAHSIVGAKEHGYLESGDTVVITSGVPIGKSGTTNMMKVDTVH